MKNAAWLSASLWTMVFLWHLLQGCVKNQEAAAIKDLSSEEKEAYYEQKAEIEIGRKLAGQLLEQYGSFEDEGLVDYVNKVGLYVGKYSDFERRYMFAILNTESVNAFAAPGGYILVSLGAIRLANSEAQLAGILGHEIAHVGKRHMMNALKKMAEEKAKESAPGGEGGALPDSLAMRQRIEPPKGGAGDDLARYLGGGAGLSVLQAATAGMTMLLTKGLDHEFEYEADQEGAKYSIRAGYNADAPIRFLRSLNKTISKENSVMSKTHPSVKSRIAKLKEVLKEMGADELIGADGRKRFTKIKRSLPPVRVAKG